MHNGQAPFQVNCIEVLMRKVDLLSDSCLRRWVDLESEDARRAGRRKPEHIRKIGVQGDQNAILADRKFSNPGIRFA